MSESETVIEKAISSEIVTNVSVNDIKNSLRLEPVNTTPPSYKSFIKKVREKNSRYPQIETDESFSANETRSYSESCIHCINEKTDKECQTEDVTENKNVCFSESNEIMDDKIKSEEPLEEEKQKLTVTDLENIEVQIEDHYNAPTLLISERDREKRRFYEQEKIKSKKPDPEPEDDSCCIECLYISTSICECSIS